MSQGMIAPQPVPKNTKCLDPNEPVLMFDGTFKAAKDIKPKDLLMGDDSTPRTVLATSSGIDEMYKIVPVTGQSYIIGNSHMLSIRCTANPKVENRKDRQSFNVYW